MSYLLTRLSRRSAPRRSASASPDLPASPDVPAVENFNTGVDFNFRDTKQVNKKKVIQLLRNEMNFTHLDAYNWEERGIEQQRELKKTDKQKRLSDYYDRTINRFNGLTEYEKYMSDNHKRFLGTLTGYLWEKIKPFGLDLRGRGETATRLHHNINAYDRHVNHKNLSDIIDSEAARARSRSTPLTREQAALSPTLIQKLPAWIEHAPVLPDNIIVYRCFPRNWASLRELPPLLNPSILGENIDFLQTYLSFSGMKGDHLMSTDDQYQICDKPYDERTYAGVDNCWEAAPSKFEKDLRRGAKNKYNQRICIIVPRGSKVIPIRKEILTGDYAKFVKEKIKIENGIIFLPTIGVLVATGECHPFYNVPVYMYRQDSEDGLGTTSLGVDRKSPARPPIYKPPIYKSVAYTERSHLPPPPGPPPHHLSSHKPPSYLPPPPGPPPGRPTSGKRSKRRRRRKKKRETKKTP